MPHSANVSSQMTDAVHVKKGSRRPLPEQVNSLLQNPPKKSHKATCWGFNSLLIFLLGAPKATCSRLFDTCGEEGPTHLTEILYPKHSMYNQ